METPWITIDRRRFRRPTVNDGASLIQLASISPYDVPDAIQARTDGSKSPILIVQFRYSTSEPLSYRAFQHGISLGLGVNSNRLYEVRLDGEKLRPVSVRLSEAGLAIEKLVADASLSRRADNYRVAAELLAENDTRLAGMVDQT